MQSVLALARTYTLMEIATPNKANSYYILSGQLLRCGQCRWTLNVALFNLAVGASVDPLQIPKQFLKLCALLLLRQLVTGNR